MPPAAGEFCDDAFLGYVLHFRPALDLAEVVEIVRVYDGVERKVGLTNPALLPVVDDRAQTDALALVPSTRNSSARAARARHVRALADGDVEAATDTVHVGGGMRHMVAFGLAVRANATFGNAHGRLAQFCADLVDVAHADVPLRMLR